MKRTTLLKTLIVATSVFAAGNFMTCTGNYNVMATEVQAAELEMFTGEWSPVQNDIASASAAVIKTGDTIAVAMFKDTMIQLKVADGVTPVITLGTETAASVVAPTGDGILIAGNQLGEGLIQVQNSVNGAVTNIVVSVLDTGNNGTVTAEASQAVTCNHPGVVNGFYSYADDHKVVSTDGMLELHLDNLVWKSDVGHEAPKLYFAEDGVLTVEAYQSQTIRVPSVCNLSGFYCFDDYLGEHGWVPVGGLGTENVSKLTNGIKYYTIQSGGHNENKVKNASTQLPVRIICKGDMYEGKDAYLWDEDQTLFPMTFGK